MTALNTRAVRTSRHITLDNGKKAKDKFTQAERALEEENEEAAENGGAAVYIWKDDLRKRIRIAMENATSEDDFLEALEDEGVKARYGTSRQHDKYISYELVDVPDHMEGADRKYKARSYTLGDAYGVKALREKLDEKAKERLRMAEQRSHATESKDDPPAFSQSGWNTEMTHTPVIKSVDVQTVRNKVDSVIRGLQQDIRAEVPSPAQQPPTTPSTAAERTEGENSIPEAKQPTQSATAPQTDTLSGVAKLKMMLKKRDEEEAQKQLENQQDDMDWFPRR